MEEISIIIPKIASPIGLCLVGEPVEGCREVDVSHRAMILPIIRKRLGSG
jgi:hypothetical protein